MNRPLKKYMQHEALQKLRNYCAYQDRCHYEIKQKCYEWGFDSEETGRIVVKLIEENFLNEERFAGSFVRGKFRYKHWGRNKIKIELKKKGITDNLIRIALKEINAEEYEEIIKKLIADKKKKTRSKNIRELNYKTANFLISKGFEADLVWDVLKTE